MCERRRCSPSRQSSDRIGGRKREDVQLSPIHPHRRIDAPPKRIEQYLIPVELDDDIRQPSDLLPLQAIPLLARPRLLLTLGDACDTYAQSCLAFVRALGCLDRGWKGVVGGEGERPGGGNEYVEEAGLRVGVVGH